MRRLFSRWRDRLGGHDTGIFRRIPLKVPGKLYTSPMPYGAYDKGNRLLRVYQQNGIQHVLVLATDDEIQRKTRRDLLGTYGRVGMTASQYPIVDFQSPSTAMLYDMVAEAVNRLQKQQVAVHCHAGVGRTAVAVCGIVMALMRLAPDEAIEHVKKYMTVNITTEQKRLIQQFDFWDAALLPMHEGRRESSAGGKIDA